MACKKKCLEFFEDHCIQFQMKLKQIEHYLKLYNQEKIKCSEYLSGQTVNFKVDGWSNVYNKPIL